MLLFFVDSKRAKKTGTLETNCQFLYAVMLGMLARKDETIFKKLSNFFQK